MTDIHELNRKRAAAAEVLRNLAVMNFPQKYEDRIAADAQYRLAVDASLRAEANYRAALNQMSTDGLIALSGFNKPTSTPQNAQETAENMVGPEGLEPPTRPL